MNSVRSLENARSMFDRPVEIVVGDFYSTDYPPERWIPSLWKGSWHVEKISGDFSRGRGRNVAFSKTKYETIFFLDADMIVPTDFFGSVLRNSSDGKAWFPICWYLSSPSVKVGHWPRTACGNLGIQKNQMVKLGPWEERTTHGLEDNALLEKAISSGMHVFRERYAGFIHQYHPKKMRYCYEK